MRAVVHAGAIAFALGSLAVYVTAGGRRHAKPPVPVRPEPGDDDAA
jgi:hypothetical protein